MDLVLVVLTAPTPHAGAAISSQILTDILWANATAADGLQHINVRPGTEPGSRITGMFLLPGATETDTETDSNADTVDRALQVCHRAIQAAPALAGWTVAVRHLKRRPTISAWPTRD